MKIAEDKSIPTPTYSRFEVDNLGDVNKAHKLFKVIKRDQPYETYMGGLMLGGALLQAVHFHKGKEAYSKTPIAVDVGPSETGKSLMAKTALATLGLEGAIYILCNVSIISTLMTQAIGFVFNDPDTDCAQDLKGLQGLNKSGI